MSNWQFQRLHWDDEDREDIDDDAGRKPGKDRDKCPQEPQHDRVDRPVFPQTAAHSRADPLRSAPIQTSHWRSFHKHVLRYELHPPSLTLPVYTRKSSP